VVLMSKSRTTLAALLAASVLLLAACAAGPNNVAQVNAPHIAGFWLGLWQGAISPVTFLVSVFNHNVNIYDVHNNGNWYNFGFMIGVSAALSGAAAGSCRPSRSERRATKAR
jgi:hypothetical protein